MTGGAGPATVSSSQCVVCAFAPHTPGTPCATAYADLLNALRRKGFHPTVASSPYAALSALRARGHSTTVRVLILADPSPKAKELVDAIHTYSPATRLWIYESRPSAAPSQLRALLPQDTAHWSPQPPTTFTPSPATTPAIAQPKPARPLRLVSDPPTPTPSGAPSPARGANWKAGESLGNNLGEFGSTHADRNPNAYSSDVDSGTHGLSHLLTDEELAMLLDSGDETGQV